MSSRAVQLYISDQFYKFCYGEKCCIKFLGFLYSLERQQFIKYIKDMSLGMHTYIFNKHEYIIVFKDSCHHIIKEPTCLNIHGESMKDMYMLNYGSESDQEEVHIDSIITRNSLPVVPQHRFSLGPLKQSLARHNSFASQFNQTDYFLQQKKQAILENLQINRVIIINEGFKSSDSTVIPMIIINDCAVKKVHCKIICVERENIVAIYNSERVADRFQEKVGETVAYQIQLQSRISDSSNLVYTTSFFLLRVLMGQSIVDSFRHISHVIIEDVHLHEAYADLLLRELKEALRYHPNLKVLLFSNSRNNKEILNYFGEGCELFLKKSNDCLIKKPQIFYLEDILQSLPEKRLSSGITKAFYALPIKSIINSNKEYLDRCLELYERKALEKYFESFLYIVKGECCNINYRHSVHGRTAIIIASLHGKINHVKTLLKFNADPYICDNQNTNAVKAAMSMGYKECADVLQMTNFAERQNKDCIDYHLILDILQMLNENTRWKNGNIMVFLPSYQHLVKLKFLILKQKLLGNIPEKVMVFLLYNTIEKSDVDAIVQKWPNSIKLILTTDIAESLLCFNDIEYVIDNGRQYRCIYNYEDMCNEFVYDYSSKDRMKTRCMILNKETGGCCFRLISKSMFEKLPELPTADLLNMNLDRVCLSVKLLSPTTMVAEYLQETIITPPFIHIHRTVENLKKINVFTNLEDITWLGCRLIDVPIECYLGKILVFAILLQCLDPILTIVGFLSTLDPLELGHYTNQLNEPFKESLRNNIKKEKQRLSEGIPSDHLMYLRLYQEWQNNFRNDDNSSDLNEYTFILNGLLEQVCNMRSQLVGSLRSSQLIHSRGDLSMHFINVKSNCWSIIKAALVGGVYPNICVFERNSNRFKSAFKKEIVLHPNSVLRPLDLDSISSLNFSSPWILFGKENNCFNCRSVECNTVVSAITVALFAGPTKLTSSCIQLIKHQQQGSNNLKCYFRIEDWICFVADYKQAHLILKTRQAFYNMYEHYLQYCGCLEGHNKRTNQNLTLSQNARLYDSIEKILTQEDKANKFSQPEKIGLRPKALPNQFIMNNNVYTLLTKSCYKITNNCNNLSAIKHHKQFFMIYSPELDDNIISNSTINPHYNNEWHNLLIAMLPPTIVEKKLTFLISYSLNPDYLHKISIAEWDKGILKLHQCFKYKINYVPFRHQISRSSSFFSDVATKTAAIQLDTNTGEFLLNIFAAYNSWIHT